MFPQAPVVKGKSYAAPLSYVGSGRRIGAAINRTASGNTGVAIVLWVFGVFAIAAAWAFVTCWYLVVFGLFGVFTFPYRLIRRSQRKNQHLQQVSLATQQAMYGQQQQAMHAQQQALWAQQQQQAAYAQQQAQWAQQQQDGSQ
jgi:hypothetical protein